MRITNCPITGLLLEDLRYSEQTVSYNISIFEETLQIVLCRECFERVGLELFLPKIHHAVLGLLLNNQLEELKSKRIHYDHKITYPNSEFDLKLKLDKAIYPKTPTEKYENLIQQLHAQQKYEGEAINLKEISNFQLWRYWYFKNADEFSLYLIALEREKFVDIEETKLAKSNLVTSHLLRFTYKGLMKYMSLSEDGSTSNKCFVAMSFQEETKPIRTAIKNALIATGFEPIIIDELNISSDRTINDEIIANLKRCKFCVADFSFHKNGVYFESGFALGQGKQVIYTCQKNEFEKAHFDIKPLQHIIYNSPEELEKALVAKIEAWIK